MATLHYIGIVEPAGSGWSISFPSFPGVATTGGTFASLARHAKDALASAVGAMQDDGEALPAAVEQDEGGLGHDLAGYTDPRSIVVSVDVWRANGAGGRGWGSR